MLALGLVVVVGLGSAVAVLAVLGRGRLHRGHPSTPAAPPAGSGPHPASLARYTLVYANADAVLVVPLNGGPSHPVRGLPGGSPGPMMAVGPSLVVAVSGTVYSVTSAVSGEAARVGAGDEFFPSVWPDVFGYVQAAPLAGSVTMSLAQVGASAPFPLSPKLPPGYRPEAHLGGEFLVSGPQNTDQSMLRLWASDGAPGGRFVRTLGRLHAVVGTRSTKVAWLAQDGCDDAGECPMHITDTTTGLDRTVAAPPGHHGFEGGGGFSPDGHRIAAFVAGASANHPVAQFAVVDVGAATSSLVAGSAVAVGEPRGFATWTPDGAYALFCGITENVRAWNVETGATLDTGTPASYDVLAF